MQKIKDFLSKPFGMIVLFVVGGVVGFMIGKKKKPVRYGRR
jgi:F0F1-type ATP synthase assembly protein I